MALQHTSGFRPVASAILGNTLVTISKFVAASLSGSSALFSEAVHSAADTLNQILLLIGLRRSLKKADDSFEYGYGNERFFWALISACGVFFLGAGVTGYRGINSLLHPKPIEFGYSILIVLLFSLFVELYTFFVAARSMRSYFPTLGWIARLRSADPMTLAVFLEDGVAVAGIFVAALSIGLSYVLEDPTWDAIGSVIIAFFLALTALVLIIKNRSYLIGRAMPDALQKKVLRLLESEPAIEKVLDFKSTVLGWGVYRIKCEVEFNGAALLSEDHQQSHLREEFDKTRDFEDFKKFSVDYADRIPRMMGRKIDEIEHRIRSEFPEIRHIDIEIN